MALSDQTSIIQKVYYHSNAIGGGVILIRHSGKTDLSTY